MSERLMNTLVEFDKEQTQAVQKIGRKALDIAEERYCSGFPYYRGGQIRKLGYNNARHDRMVGDGSAQLGAYIGFSPAEQELARTTGYAHDIVQLKGRGTDERESAEWIEKQFRDHKSLPPVAARMASVAIIATEPIFENGAIVGQRVDRMDFDSKAHELFAKDIVSADLGELYTPMGPYLSHRLYGQRQDLDATATPDMSDLYEFQGKQILFLEGYRYPLAEANEVFVTHRQRVIEYAYFVYERLKQGEIPSWEHLMAFDVGFMHDPTQSFTQLMTGVWPQDSSLPTGVVK